MLSVRNVSKKFVSSQGLALDNVSLTINPGEIFSLIGPNGSGKTTLVKIIAGLLQPSAGKIVIEGIDAFERPEMAKSLIGYIPDEPTVWPYITGEEFLHLTGALFHVPASERAKKIARLLDVFGLKNTEQQYYDDYSRGNRQKFSILSALAHSPRLLLIDEPIVGLDPSSAQIAKEQFVDYAKQGGAILLVTHTLAVAEAIANRIGIISHGKIIAVGSLRELRKKAKLKADASLEMIYQAFIK